MPETRPEGLAEKPVTGLLQEIREGTLSPKLLEKLHRQRCVEALLLEGTSHVQIAQFLECSEKTIQRDVAEIRVRNAAAPPSLELAKQLIGDYMSKTEAHHAYLMRLARTKEASVAERAQAEALAAKVLSDRFDRLQSLGYLPQRPQQVVGDVVHHLGGEESERSLEDVGNTLHDIAAVGQETHTLTPELLQRLQLLQLRLEELKLSHEAQHLLTQQQHALEAKETPHEPHP